MAELDYDALREAAETALEAGRQHSFIVPPSLYRFHDAFTPSVGVALLDRVRELEAEVAHNRQIVHARAIDEMSPTRVEAERDAALAAVERVRAAVKPWGSILSAAKGEVLAALDGAPEPEVEAEEEMYQAGCGSWDCLAPECGRA